MAASEPIRCKKDLKALAFYFLKRGELRNYAMVVLGVCTALRISDLLRLRWEDVYDSETGHMKTHLEVTERKTKKKRVIALNRKAAEALLLLKRESKSEYIFSNRRKTEKPISRVQAWRILRGAAENLRLTGRISCHSLRKTFGYFARKNRGITPELLMRIYNHSDFSVTLRYLGITQDELDHVYLSTPLF